MKLGIVERDHVAGQLPRGQLEANELLEPADAGGAPDIVEVTEKVWRLGSRAGSPSLFRDAPTSNAIAGSVVIVAIAYGSGRT